MKPTVSVIIPCYNEAANLRELLPRLCAELERCSERWEIVLVDDGSADDDHDRSTRRHGLHGCHRHGGVRHHPGADRRALRRPCQSTTGQSSSSMR